MIIGKGGKRVERKDDVLKDLLLSVAINAREFLIEYNNLHNITNRREIKNKKIQSLALAIEALDEHMIGINCLMRNDEKNIASSEENFNDE